MSIIGDYLADINVIVKELVIRCEGPAEIEAVVAGAGGEFVVVGVVAAVGVGSIKGIASHSGF